MLANNLTAEDEDELCISNLGGITVDAEEAWDLVNLALVPTQLVNDLVPAVNATAVDPQDQEINITDVSLSPPFEISSCAGIKGYRILVGE